MLPGMKLSILMPVYNEAPTISAAIKEVLNVSYPCEIELVIVDDGSTDGTRDIYPSLGFDDRVTVRLHDRNQGKGAAIATAAAAASGDYVIMCDADLEYAPAEIPALLAPVIHQPQLLFVPLRARQQGRDHRREPSVQLLHQRSRDLL